MATVPARSTQLDRTASWQWLARRLPLKAVCTGKNLANHGGNLLFWSLLSWLLILQIGAILESPFYGPASLVEESAYTYTSSRNYLQFGYLNSGLLQDFSNSTDPADHPYVYNHMPPGPDLTLALLLQLTGQSYTATRIVLACLFFVGMWFYVRFAQMILDRLELSGAGFIALFLWPWVLIQGMERLIYNLFPLLAFAPLVALGAYYRTGRRWYLVAAAGIAFVSSIYLEYSLLTGVIFCWILLWATQLVRIDRRHAVLILGTIALGIFAHLVQNFLYLGPQTFVRELAMTISNRTTGIPGQTEMKAFYQQLGIVHHGSHRPELATLAQVAESNLKLPEGLRRRLFWVAVVGLLLVLKVGISRGQHPRIQLLGRRAARTAFMFLLMAIWICGTILAPIIAFPAFAQEVNMKGSGANSLFLSIGIFALFAFGVKQLWRWGPRVGGWIRSARTMLSEACPLQLAFKPQTFSLCLQRNERFTVRHWTAYGMRRNVVACLACLPALMIWIQGLVTTEQLVYYCVKQRAQEYRGVADIYKRNEFARLEDLQKFRGELYMTNINTPAVGFFVESPGYGVCGPDSITPSGEVLPKKGKVAFMRRDYNDVSPRYYFYFWSKALFPGFADCLPVNTLVGAERGGEDCMKEMQHRLDSNFELVHDNGLFRVYDLHRRRRGDDSPDVSRPRHEVARRTDQDWVPCCGSE